MNQWLLLILVAFGGFFVGCFVGMVVLAFEASRRARDRA